MTRLQLQVYRDPGQVETFLNIRRSIGGYVTRAVIIDTGAEISLLPEYLLDEIAFRPTDRGRFEIQQAGIADQVFSALEAEITVYLEDLTGNRSAEFTIPAWFSRTGMALVGFGGILERVIFHLDMPNLSGYLEL